MIPQFDHSQVNSKLSKDILASAFTLMLLGTVAVYFFLTQGFHDSDIIKFGVVAGIILLQVLSHFIPKVKDLKTFNSGGVGALLVYNIACALLFLWFIPLYSPFVMIWMPVMFITIYYRGLVGFFISIFALITMVIVVSINTGVPNVPYAQYYPYITIILGIAYGGIIQRISSIDNQVRTAFEKVSNKVELDREQLSSLINNMTDAVLAVDQEGNVLFHNSAVLALLGQGGSLEGKRLADFMPLFDSADHAVDLLGLAHKENRDLRPSGLHFNSANHEKIELYIDIAPIRSNFNQQQKQGFIVLLRDITKEKTLDQQRDEFIAVTSHELRTPIATAEGNVSFVLHSKLIGQMDLALRHRLELAHKNIIFLGDLVNDLDLLTKAESRALPLESNPIDSGTILRQLEAEFQKDAAEKNLQLSVTVAPDLPKINSSPGYTYDILKNLVSNAIKYTERGSISVQAAKGDGETIRFSVVDTGMGIGQSDRARLFHKFYRSEDYRTRQTRGTGLGLYTSLKLAEHLHGKLWFESEINRGSTFYLQLPSISLTKQP